MDMKQVRELEALVQNQREKMFTTSH